MLSHPIHGKLFLGKIFYVSQIRVWRCMRCLPGGLQPLPWVGEAAFLLCCGAPAPSWELQVSVRMRTSGKVRSPSKKESRI